MQPVLRFFRIHNPHHHASAHSSELDLGADPEAFLVQPSSYVGLRNLSINGAGTTDTAGVSFNNMENSWVQGVALLHSYNIGVYIVLSSHITVADNYVYDTGQNLKYGDPMSIKDTVAANNLIQNNIIQSCRVAVMNGEGPAAGDVIGYNLAINAYDAADGLWGSFWQHANGDDYNLYEGNVGAQMFQDNIHGSHLMITGYRNFFYGWESCANGNCGSYTAKDTQLSAVDDLSYNRYGNYIANVLGTPGIETSYSYSAAGYYTGSGTRPVWNIGSGNSGGTYRLRWIPITGTTLYRWGNYDTYDGATEWNTSEVPSGIPVYPQSVSTATCTSSIPCPASFYLSSKPSWFGSNPWPAIGPDVSSGNVGQIAGAINQAGQYNGLPGIVGQTYAGSSVNGAWGGHVNAIPAMNCFLNIMGGKPDGTGSALSFNAATCYAASSGNSLQAPTSVVANPH